MIKYIKERILLRKLRKKDNRISEEIELTKHLLELYNEREEKPYLNLLNTYLYFSIVNRELYYLAELHYFEKNTHRKNFFARLICMTVVELLDDANSMLGKKLLSEMESENLTEFIPDINLLNKKYSELKKEYSSNLRDIRNNAAAHKNKNPLIILEMHKKVTEFDVKNICLKVSMIHSFFMDIVLSKIFNHLMPLIDKNK
jgi:hypothetical protein